MGVRLAYLIKKGDKFAYVVDGKVEKFYEEVGKSYFTPLGTHFLYWARIGKKYTYVIDGKEGKQYDGISYPVFSQKGERIAYRGWISKEGKNFLIVDGNEWAQYDEFIDSNLLTFTPDGKHLIYALETPYLINASAFTICVDKNKGKEYMLYRLWVKNKYIVLSKLVVDSPQEFHYLACILQNPKSMRNLFGQDISVGQPTVFYLVTERLSE